MSIKATNWAWSQKLHPSYKLVLLALADRHNADTQKCYPSITLVAECCGISESSVKRAIKMLKDMGLLRIIRRVRGDGSFTSNFYTFPFDEYKLQSSSLSDNKYDEVEDLPEVTVTPYPPTDEGVRVHPRTHPGSPVDPPRVTSEPTIGHPWTHPGSPVDPPRVTSDLLIVIEPELNRKNESEEESEEESQPAPLRSAIPKTTEALITSILSQRFQLERRKYWGKQFNTLLTRDGLDILKTKALNWIEVAPPKLKYPMKDFLRYASEDQSPAKVIENEEVIRLQDKIAVRSRNFVTPPALFLQGLLHSYTQDDILRGLADFLEKKVTDEFQEKFATKNFMEEGEVHIRTTKWYYEANEKRIAEAIAASDAEIIRIHAEQSSIEQSSNPEDQFPPELLPYTQQ